MMCCFATEAAHGPTIWALSWPATQQLLCAGPPMLRPCLQVELADVIVINKMDLAKPAALDQLERMLRALNPGAQLLRVRRQCQCRSMRLHAPSNTVY